MRVPLAHRSAALAGVVLLLAACSTGGATPTPAGNGGGGTSPGAPTSATGGGGGGSGADAGTLNACTLLTTAEISAAVGWAVSDGVLQNSDGQTDCEWAAQQTDGGSVGLTIANYDDFVWQAGASAGNSKAVSGIGDAAFKDWPHAGVLNIKVKGYAVSVAIIDFQATNDKLDAEDLSLAQLVLPRL